MKHPALEKLFNINKEELQSSDIFEIAPKIDEMIKPQPKGRVIDLILLFDIIKVMRDAGLNFIVKGGIILHYFLGEHARKTNNLDIIIFEDSYLFAKKLEKAFQKTGKFKILYHAAAPIHKYRYYESFTFDIETVQTIESHIKFVLTGVVNAIEKPLDIVEYPLPSVIADNLTFKGVPLEFMMAEKIIAVTNDLLRPYKHLVDCYTLSHMDFDMVLLKKYLDMIIKSENKVKAMFGKEITPHVYQIQDDKAFTGSYLFVALDAGYEIPHQDMIKEINVWLKSHLE